MSVVASVFADCGCGQNNQSQADLVQDEKVYVTQEHLCFSEQTMFVYINNDWQPINSLYSDKGGLFIIYPEAGASSKTWYCSTCTTYHSCNSRCPITKEDPPSSCK
jgi:hypothetical protein